MNYFVSYDISHNRSRERVAKTLLRHGCVRVQQSVFYAQDFSPEDRERLRSDLAASLGEHLLASSILFLPIERDQLGLVDALGDNGALVGALYPPGVRQF